MKNKYHALMWDQWRMAAPIAGVMFALFLFALGVTHLMRSRELIAPIEAFQVPINIAYLCAIAGGLSMLLRPDSRAHLVLGFEPRLTRLPVGTVALALCSYLTRLAVFAALLAGIHAALQMFPAGRPVTHGITYHPAPLLAAYALGQALAWSYQRVRWVSYGVVAAAVLGFLAIGVLTAPAGARVAAASDFAQIAVTGWPFAVTVLAFAVGLALLGVHAERRERTYGPPPLRRLLEAAGRVGAAAPERFSSPLAAQIWYEQRRFGRLLLLVFLTVLAAIQVYPAAFGESFDSPFIRQYAAHIALLIAAPIAAIGAAIAMRSRYAFCMPVATRRLAAARLIVCARALALCVFLVMGYHAALWLFTDAPHGVVMRTAWELEVIRPAAIAYSIILPALAAGALAWLFMAGFVGAMTLGVLAALNFVTAIFWDIAGAEQGLALLPWWLPFAIIYGVLVAVTVLALLSRVWTSRHVAALVMVWAAVTLLIWAMDGTGVHGRWLAVLGAAAALVVLVAPGTALSLHRKRVRSGVWNR